MAATTQVTLHGAGFTPNYEAGHTHQFWCPLLPSTPFN